MMNKIGIVFALFSLMNTVTSHDCIHKANYNIAVREDLPTDYSDEQNRNLADAQFRLTYDTSNLATSVTNTDQLNLLMKTVEVAKLFYVNLLVAKNQTPGKIYPKANLQCNYSFSAAQISDGESNSDFHFYIQAQPQPADQTWIATSEACMTQGVDNRTIMGVVTINLTYLQNMTTSNYDFQNYVDVFIHEMFHSLVFSPSLFQLYTNPITNKPYTASVDYNLNTGNSYFVSFPNCVQWAKQYYACDSITSFPLEDNGLSGSAGAHWERTVLQNDIMTASSLAGYNLWSGLNNALIQDSGWYTLRTDSAPYALDDKISWGKGKGCDFFNNRCTNNIYPEFCNTVNENLNTFSYSGLGFCSDKDIYSQCKYVAPYKNQLCMNENNKLDPTLGAPLYQRYFSVFDATSRSFTSNLSPSYLDPLKSYFAVCYPYTCKNSNQSVSIQLGSTEIDCNSDSQVINNVTGFTGQLVCPSSISNFCDKFQSCPDSCSQRGYCISGVCRCIQNIVGLNQSNCDCDPGFFINQSNTCQSCNIAKCAKCRSANSCTQCEMGYYYLNGQCQQCSENCLDCDATGACIKCTYGYLATDSSKTCSKANTHTSIIHAISFFTFIFILIAIY